MSRIPRTRFATWATPMLGLALILFQAPSARAALPPTLLDQTWSEARVSGFVVLTNMGNGVATKACRDLAEVSEALRRTNPILASASPEPTHVFIVGGESLYVHYSPPQSQNVEAFFTPGMDRNLIVVDGSAADHWHALVHEYTHTHLRANFPGIPSWLDEGLAEFYSTLRVRGQVVEAGHDLEWCRRWLATNEPASFDILFAFNPAAPAYRADNVLRTTLYAESWALVQFIETHPDRAAGFDAFLQRHRNGMPARKAFTQSFPEDGWPQLLADLRQYLKDDMIQPRSWKLAEAIPRVNPETRDVPAGEALARLGVLQLETDRAEEAADHLAAALHADSTCSVCLAGLGYLADERGDSAAAEEYYARSERSAAWVAAAGLMSGLGTLQRFMRASEYNKPDTTSRTLLEARKRFERCLAKAPEDDGALSGWARTYIFGQTPPPATLEAARRVSDAMPARPDFSWTLLVLDLAAHRIDDAHHLVDARMAAELDPQDLERANHLIDFARRDTAVDVTSGRVAPSPVDTFETKFNEASALASLGNDAAALRLYESVPDAQIPFAFLAKVKSIREELHARIAIEHANALLKKGDATGARAALKSAMAYPMPDAMLAYVKKQIQRIDAALGH